MHINHLKNVKINYACNFCYLLAFSMQWTQEWTRKLHTQLKCPKAFYSEKNFPLIYVHVWICLLKAINHLWNCLHFFVSFFWKLKLLMVFFLDSKQELSIVCSQKSRVWNFWYWSFKCWRRDIKTLFGIMLDRVL